MKFLDALKKAKQSGRNVVIPDIKIYSPKDGPLLKSEAAAGYAKMLEAAGAPVISVVTEEKEFHGSLDLLREIADTVNIPILRKDFIHTKEDLIRTKNAGASAILLMCACLEKEEMKYLFNEALSLGLDPFFETHLPEDIAFAKELNAKLIGINNRDILKLEKDDGNVNHTLSMLKDIPKEAFTVTESSIKDPEEVRSAISAGADAALVGTAIAKAPDPAIFYRMLNEKVSLKICGLMNSEDIKMCIREGVERIGLVTEYPLPVPWNLKIEKAEILRREIPKGFRAVMVTGGDTEKILDLAEKVKPDMVQLHYKETLEQTRIISSELKKYGIGVIKTIPLSKKDALEQFKTDDIETIVKLLCDTDIAEILVDPRQADVIDRKDLNADEELFKKIKAISSKPVILAGGLNGDNLKEILSRTGAEAVDIMNGSEAEPGKKDIDKIRKITAALQLQLGGTL